MKKINIIFIGVIIILGIFIFGTERNKNEKEDKNNVVNEINENNEPNFLGEQINEGGGVKVIITPIDQTNLGFKIVLETHSVDLNYDLTKIVILVDEDGNKYEPISWEGSPAGGHHREGVIQFDENIKAEFSVLIIKDVGGVEERKFELST